MFEGRVEGLVTRLQFEQQKSFEKPGRVRQVPLGRACIVKRLDAVVLNVQRRSQFLCLSPYTLEAF